MTEIRNIEELEREITRLKRARPALKAAMAKPININSQFKVMLTAYGAEVWNNRYAELIGKHLTESVATGDVIFEELWQLMQVFGAVLYNGNTKIPFEGNVIEGVLFV